ncbi:MAG: MFS transporter [Rhodobacteraceae bacterium]|nr:MFS transporter [Paracoccaceae bacterium]
MLTVLASSWALLLGIMLLMMGNGIQGTLLGVRGGIEGFSAAEMSYVMAGYYAGFLLGSRLAPDMIRRVGHIRVFSALGSLISAVLVLYPVAPDWIAWAALRAVIGFCFCGVYITAESWLNNSATNETRGQALSLYMIVQMIGMIASQALMNVADPAGFELFILPSVLVSLAFMPILLTAAPAPSFESTAPLSFARLFQASPLGCVGMFLLGGIYAALFGMAAVWGSEAGLTVGQISTYVALIFVGGLISQYPIGFASDRFGRRRIILGLGLAGAAVALLAAALPLHAVVVFAIGIALGGIANPLYALLLAYTNDFLDNSDMAAASAGLIFINGLGAIGGPILTGWLMVRFGADAYFLFMGVLFLALAGYAAWRMTRRSVLGPAVPSGIAVMSTSASAIAVEAAMEAREGRARAASGPGH